MIDAATVREALHRSTFTAGNGQGQRCPCGQVIHVTAPAAERFTRGNAAMAAHWAGGCQWVAELATERKPDR